MAGNTKEAGLDARIAQVNQRLKAARLGLQLERRGGKLNLRGTFPPRPSSSRLRSHQQRLSLGLPATVANLKLAEQEAKIIAAKLIQQTFNWRDYSGPTGPMRRGEPTLAQQLQAFEADFFAQRSQAAAALAAAKTTWRSTYAPYLRQLVTTLQEQPRLTLAEGIYATVRATRPNSRSRQTCCTALGAFAAFVQLELPVELKSFWGSYNPGQTQARELPSDELIIQTFEQIPNPTWRFVYGVMATYGLRNHEVFFADYRNLQKPGREAILEVLPTTKTGSHEVWPFHPEWVELFGLRQGSLPPINTDLNQITLQRIGQQVTRQFRRYGLPFAPYDLRHAWAVRTIHIGLPDTVAARMMGHSVAVHNRTYHRWISRRDQQQAVTAALKRRECDAQENRTTANVPFEGLQASLESIPISRQSDSTAL